MNRLNGISNFSISSWRCKKLIRNLWLFVLLFFYIFSPRINCGLVFHLGIISVLAVVSHWFFSFKSISIPKPFFVVLIFTALLLLYHSLLALVYGNDFSFLLSILVTIVVNIWFGLRVGVFCNNYDSKDVVVDKVILFCSYAIFLNCFIILLQFIFPDFKILVELALFQSESSNIDYLNHPFRLRGLSAGGGASLSVVNALGILFIFYLTTRRNVSDFTAILISITILISNVFVGRTGLVFSFLFFGILFLYVFFRNFSKNSHGKMKALLILITLTYAMSLFLHADYETHAVKWAFEWVDGILATEIQTESTDELSSMLFLPENPIHLIGGIGFFEGENRVYPRSDSGYLKTIFSLGMPLGFIFYSFIIFFLWRLCWISDCYKWLIFTLIVYLLIVEVKEPFLYQNYSSRIIFLLSGLAIFYKTSKSIR